MSYNKKAIMRIVAILLAAVATLALMLPAVLTQANAAETDASTADQNAFVSVQGGKDSLVNDNGLLHGTYLTNGTEQSNSASDSVKFVPTFVNGTKLASNNWQTLEAVYTIRNTSNEAKGLNTWWLLPKYSENYDKVVGMYKDGRPLLNVDAARMTGDKFTQFANIPEGVNLTFKGATDATYNMNGDVNSFLSSYSWDKLAIIHFGGKLPAGASITLRMPLKLEQSLDKVDPSQITSLQEAFSSPAPTNGILIRVTNGEALENLNAHGKPVFSEGVWYGVVRDYNEAGQAYYSRVPDNIQEALPSVADSKVTTYPWLTGQQKTVSANERHTYPGERWDLDLHNIRTAIAPLGWSVAHASSNSACSIDSAGICTRYAYINVDGITIDGGEQKGYYDGQPIASHVELRKVLDGHDIELRVGDTWNEGDNLDEVFGVKANFSPLDRSAEKNELIADGTVSVEDNVDTSKPGEYTVKYIYNPDTPTNNSAAPKARAARMLSAAPAAASTNNSDLAVSITRKVVVRAQPVTVTFDPQNGEKVQTVTVDAGTGLSDGQVPSFKRDGYTFDGWYTAAEGGEKVADVTAPVNENTTYYAHWTAEAVDPGTKPDSNTDDNKGSNTGDNKDNNSGNKTENKPAKSAKTTKSTPASKLATTGSSVIAVLALALVALAAAGLLRVFSRR